MMRHHPIVKGMTNPNMAHLRPIRLMRMPIGMQTAAAPKFRDDPTHEACSELNVKSYSDSVPASSFGFAGEVHPSAAPRKTR